MAAETMSAVKLAPPRTADLRTFAVNIHLKFPFAVLGGILVIPTWEEAGSKAARKAEEVEEVIETQASEKVLDELTGDDEDASEEPAAAEITTKSTVHLIQKAIMRLMRAGGRKT